MRFWVFLIILFSLSVPVASVYAIPPPDLIFSLSQSILSIFGLVMASLVVAFTTARAYFAAFMTVPAVRLVWRLMLGVLAIGTVVFVGLVVNDWRLENWRQSVQYEVAGIWDEYMDTVYSAPNEKLARQQLSGTAAEVTWNEFIDQVGDEDYLIVDIRDSHAYAAGSVVGSVHIRLADLIRGRWEELLPYQDKPIMLVCYLGSTGALASTFLASKGFTNLYQPKEGLTISVKRDASMPFRGDSLLPLTREQRETLPKIEAQEKSNTSNVTVIDLRSPAQYNEPTDIKPTTQMNREVMTIPEIDTFIEALPESSQYMLLCNSDASCYQGKMLWFDLDAVNREVVGVYDASTPAGFPPPGWFIP
jgi:rhodanese-related sulfurtransferase